jgi:glycosyltransferase 2 family protein
VKSLGQTRAVVVFSALGWLGECAMLYLVARAVGTPISPAAAGTVALITALLTTIPITPGGLGVAEAGIVLMLGQLGVAAGPAAAIAVLARAISFGSVILGGGLSWLLAAQSGDQPIELPSSALTALD